MLNTENRYLFKFAWKSIRRNAGRSFFIGFSVSLAVVIAVWVIAFFDGLNSQIEKAVVNTNTGFFQVQDPVYAATTDSSSPREFTPTLAQTLSKEPVSAASPELVLDGNISTPEGATGLLVIGIDPEIHKQLMPIYEKITSGTFLTQDDEYGVVIGQELATLFKFNVGDQMVLNYQDKVGELRSELITIRGIYHYNSKGFEKRFVYINQKTWQNLFLNEYTGKTLFNRVTILTPDLKYEPIVHDRIQGTDLKLKSWKQLNPEMAVVLEFHDGMIKFFFLIIALTITMTIMTPVRMLWQERFKELKMMSIIGVSASKFWKIGIYEVILMILLSSVFSIFMLTAIIGTQTRNGVDFRYLNDGVAIERAGIKLPGIIFPKLTPEQLLITFLFVIFVLSISYLWSIYRTLTKLEAEI
ncbi:ABC transporter permease [Peredibacter starrii]|uniref:FtsX-like permease family protein n=1 Tax=Peredibacter starrii TaxID=28202 RepID=A0AAX4HNU2_9BACT|nr:ABC transporter permease [Peredibacter starrii]WPU64990.1 FtsX-like permease family protein [Peredibacter starrii]